MTASCLLPLPCHARAGAAAALLCLLLALSGLATADTLKDARDLMVRGEPAAALSRIEESLAADPNNTNNTNSQQLRFMRGVALMDLNRLDEARVVFQQMSLEFPELPEPFNNLALLAVRAGQLDQARLALETALRNDPSHRSARANLAEVYLMLADQHYSQLAQTGELERQQQTRLKAVRALLGRATSP